MGLASFSKREEGEVTIRGSNAGDCRWAKARHVVTGPEDEREAAEVYMGRFTFLRTRKYFVKSHFDFSTFAGHTDGEGPLDADIAAGPGRPLEMER